MNPTLKTVIIDDEPDCVHLLAMELNEHCPQVQVVARCTDSTEGLAAILHHEPDLVFLDIEMPRMNGFQLLEKVSELNFCLIFVTAYDKFAIKAFRLSALDYLLKPIDSTEMIQAVSKAERKVRLDNRQLHLLREHYQAPKPLSNRIALPHQNGMIFADISDILYCEADNNYTKIMLADRTVYLVSKTLREAQDMLEERGFVRVHRQYLVNLEQIKKYVRGEGCYLVMNNNQTIPISRNQKEKLLEKIGWL